MQIDLGDVVATFELKVKGRKRYAIRLHFGPEIDSTTEERSVHSPVSRTTCRPKGPIMDLAADKKRSVQLEWTDEVGNPTGVPADAMATYSTDNPAVLALTDNGDGTAVVASTGVLGSANVHLDASAGGETFTGDETVNVVAGLAERVSMKFGDEDEVTPDDV